MPEPPCVGCGHCCKGAVCPFGQWDDDANNGAGRCAYLVPWEDDTLADADGSVPRYRCSKHSEIAQLAYPSIADVAPAFGAGCCQPLCNDARNRIVRTLERTNHDQAAQP